MEETLPPQTADGAGFEPVRVQQFTVFLENKVGRLQMLLRTLEQGQGKIAALAIEESADCALVRLICSVPDASAAMLSEAGFTFSESDVLVVELPRRSRQPLISLCSALLSAEINMHYAYPMLLGGSTPAMAIYVDDPTLASQVLIRKQFILLSQADLGNR